MNTNVINLFGQHTQKTVHYHALTSQTLQTLTTCGKQLHCFNSCDFEVANYSVRGCVKYFVHVIMISVKHIPKIGDN